MDKTTIIIIGVVAVVLVLLLLLTIASFANEKFSDDYKKLRATSTRTPYTISMMIERLNSSVLKNQVTIVPISRPGGDFYNAKKKMVAINMNSATSLASFAVIAHELGHAYQDIVENKLKSFNRLRVAGSIVGKLFLPILVCGIVALFYIEDFLLVLTVTGGGLAFIILLAIMIKTKTIKIEKQASEIGMNFLKDFLPDDELKQCKKLLNSARLTYWSDLIKLLLGWSGLTNKTQMFR